MVVDVRLEKIADDFIEFCLKDRPVMIFSLDFEIEEYIRTIELDKNKDTILKEYWARKINDTKKIEMLNELNRGLYEGPSDSELGDSNLLLHYIRTIPDLIIGELIALVLTSRNIRIRRFEELEDANLEDPIMPNEWIYHKDMNSTESSNYVRTYYDDNRQDEEIDGW